MHVALQSHLSLFPRLGPTRFPTNRIDPFGPWAEALCIILLTSSLDISQTINFTTHDGAPLSCGTRMHVALQSHLSLFPRLGPTRFPTNRIDPFGPWAEALCIILLKVCHVPPGGSVMVAFASILHPGISDILGHIHQDAICCWILHN